MKLKKKRVIFAATYLLLDQVEEQEKKSSKRTKWVSEWIKKRNQFGCYENLMNELRLESPNLFRNFLRMSAEDYEFLLNRVSPIIQKQVTIMRSPISAGERLAVTLRYLATGETFSSLQYIFRIPQSTISKIVPEVCDAIYEVLQDDFLKCPTTENDWRMISQRYYSEWNFPNCLGAIDGKHVEIIAPVNAGSLYYNYKKTHSIVLMGICDADYNLIYIDVGVNGRHSDGGVFKNCTFYKALSQELLNIPSPTPLPGREIPVPFVLVADDAFAMSHHLLKPYATRNLTGTQRIFNYRLSRARRIIENVFGIMSSVFRVLRSRILLDPHKAAKITKATSVLHNFLIKRNKRLYAPNGTFDNERVDGTISPGSWRTENENQGFYNLEPSRSNGTQNAKEIREEFEKFFVAEGEVPFQYSQI
uniref:CSON001967 protein n=1 Tax=Culicoides sonorensis TaxID=179676 RepID=A0A336MP40_CULSO